MNRQKLEMENIYPAESEDGGPRETEGGAGESSTPLNISAQKTKGTGTLLLFSHL